MAPAAPAANRANRRRKGDEPDAQAAIPRRTNPTAVFGIMGDKFGNGRRIAELAVDMGKPVWFDMDDNVWAVRRSHPNYAGIRNPEFLKIVEWFVLNSTFITVSTEELKKTIKQFELTGPLGTTTEVVPNALDDYTMAFRKPSDSIVPTAHWRGGSSHQEDLRHFEKGLSDIAGMLYFHGFDPWWMGVNESHVFPYIPDYYRYMAHLRFKNPRAVVVPLMDCPFNRCKSNIAALEAIWAGSIPIVPGAWEEWDIPGAFAYTTQFDIAEITKQVLHLSSEAYRKNINQLQAWVLENRVLSVVNQQRVKILERLVRL